MRRVNFKITLIATLILVVTFFAFAYASRELPKEFQGKWEESEKWAESVVQPGSVNKSKSESGESEFLITSDSILWKRKQEGKTTIKAEQVTVADNGQKLKFKAEKIAFRNSATGDKPMRPIDVELTREGNNLVASISAGTTQVQGTGLVVKSPPTKFIYKRN